MRNIQLMPKNYIPFYFIFALLAFTSCKNDDGNYTAYFGGEINNPQSPYVFFSKGNKIIDTITLDNENRFFVKFDSLTPGMYSFRHEPEYQYVYFEKNDSLMVSVNTANFDQSLVFSGRGEKKNNFMMEVFLLNEQDRDQGYRVYEKDFSQFKKNIDSVYAHRKDFYNKNKAAIKWSDGFDFFAKHRVDLNYYTKKEYYPYLHLRRTGKDVKSQLPDDYYAYRKKLDYNDAKLVSFSPFVRYLSAMLNNMSIAKSNKSTAYNSLENNLVKMDIADSVFTDEEIKNQVLNNIAFSYLLEDQDIQNNQKFLEHFMQLSTDSDEANEIKKIGRALKRLNSGSRLPEIALVDTNNKPFSISGTAQAKTVIFFWTTCAPTHMETVHRRVKQLHSEYPDIKFIAVNVDGQNEWKKALANKNNEFSQALQLRAADFRALKENWVLTKVNRAIILNPNGTLKNAFTSLLDENFPAQLQ